MSLSENKCWFQTIVYIFKELIPYLSKLECLSHSVTSTLVKYLWAGLNLPSKISPLRVGSYLCKDIFE
jgi:hypothetical protein